MSLSFLNLSVAPQMQLGFSRLLFELVQLSGLASSVDTPQHAISVLAYWIKHCHFFRHPTLTPGGSLQLSSIYIVLHISNNSILNNPGPTSSVGLLANKQLINKKKSQYRVLEEKKMRVPW